MNGTYTINRLGDTEKPSKYGIIEYEVKEQVATGNFTSGKTIDKNVFAKLASGRYQIKLDANDSQGRPVTTKQDFILYSLRDKRPPVFMHTWMLDEKMSGVFPVKRSKILFGTSDKDATYFI